MDLNGSNNLEETAYGNLESDRSQNREEDYLYSLIDMKLDKMYSAARNGSNAEVNGYQEELRNLYQSIEPVELDRLI